jgi:hypothetical protein
METEKVNSVEAGFWALVDLYGHTKTAGYVTETSIGGCSFVRVDTPAEEGTQLTTKFYGNGAIYSITPVSEEVVRLFVKRYKPAPINVYIPEIKEIPEKTERPVGCGREDYEDVTRDWDGEDAFGNG